MVTTAPTTCQPRAALEKANALRFARAAEFRRLYHAPARVVIPALINPSSAFATYRLGEIFERSKGSLVYGIGPCAFRQMLTQLSTAGMRRHWHPELRLADLSKGERRRFAIALLAASPASWSGLGGDER